MVAVDRNHITSGITEVERDKKVIFTLDIKDKVNYSLDRWDVAIKDENNPLVAHLSVSVASLLGSYKSWNTNVKITRKGTSSSIINPSEINVK